MRPANDQKVDYKDLVRRGYDQCALKYFEARRDEPQPELEWLIAGLPKNSRIVDIGCGSGIPVARTLSEKFQVTGVDISLEQIKLARNNVPSGEFIHADIMKLRLPPGTFSAVVSFYTVFHIPREEHKDIFRKIHTWLKPGGLMLVTLANDSEAPYLEDDFFETTMYWSNYGLKHYLRLFESLQFELLKVTETGHGYQDDAIRPAEHHPVVLAKKIIS